MKRVGVSLASVGHVSPGSSVVVYDLLQKPCVVFSYKNFMKK